MFDGAAQLQLYQSRRAQSRRYLALAKEFVNATRRRSQLFEQGIPGCTDIIIGEFGQRLSAGFDRLGLVERLHWRQAVEHVLSRANQGGPVAEQLVGDSRAGVEWIAGNRTDFA